MKLCQDPVVKKLHEIFDANIKKVPEERFQPLSVITRREKDNKFWGDLGVMVDGDIMELEKLIENSGMAGVSGKITKEAKIGVGLEILEGFLKGFNLPATSISEKFNRAKKLAFSFQNVNRKYIAPANIVSFLKGIPLDKERSDVQDIIDGKVQMYVIDSIITSSDFSIHVSQSLDVGGAIDIPAIEGIVTTNPSVSFKKDSESTVSFKGDKSLTFAFSCLICDVDKAGRINFRPKSLPRNTFERGTEELEHFHFSEEFEMVGFV